MSTRINRGQSRPTDGLGAANGYTTQQPSPPSPPPNRGRNPGNATSATTAAGRREALQTFDNMMYSYHQNFRSYNQNVQLMIDGVLTNRTFARTGLDEITAINTVYNENMRAYTDTVNTSLGIYRDIYFGGQPRSTTTEQPTNSLLRTTTRPRAFVNYTVFPIIQPVTDTNDEPLSNDQIQQFTEEYRYEGVARSEDRQHFCSISLDMFQEGDCILRIRQCGHEFKSEPLLQWFRRSSKCPLCRCNLLDASSNIALTTPPLRSDISGAIIEDDGGDDEVTSPPILPGSDSEPQESANIDRPTLQSVIQHSIQNGIQEIFSNRNNFNEMFESMLMSNTNAPPTITSDMEPIIQTLLREVISPIESIDITYTVEHVNEEVNTENHA